MNVRRIGSDLELRPVVESDAPVFLEAILANRERLRQWLPWVRGGYSLDDSRRFAAEAEKNNDLRASLTLGIWSAGVLCGSIGLHKIDYAHRNSSIGYWIDAAHEGGGIVTNACRAVISEGFDDYNLNRIEIRCATGNERSCSIPRRLGFVEEGVLREAEWLYDHWVDLRLFAMLRRDWQPCSKY